MGLKDKQKQLTRSEESIHLSLKLLKLIENAYKNTYTRQILTEKYKKPTTRNLMFSRSPLGPNSRPIL